MLSLFCPYSLEHSAQLFLLMLHINKYKYKYIIYNIPYTCIGQCEAPYVLCSHIHRDFFLLVFKLWICLFHRHHNHFLLSRLKLIPAPTPPCLSPYNPPLTHALRGAYATTPSPFVAFSNFCFSFNGFTC